MLINFLSYIFLHCLQYIILLLLKHSMHIKCLQLGLNKVYLLLLLQLIHLIFITIRILDLKYDIKK